MPPTTQTEDQQGAGEAGSVMVYLNGSKVSFRCDCGCNVFSKAGGKYYCNGCNSAWIGIPASDEADATESPK
jgi:hypothetical protein